MRHQRVVTYTQPWRRSRLRRQAAPLSSLRDSWLQVGEIQDGIRCDDVRGIRLLTEVETVQHIIGQLISIRQRRQSKLLLDQLQGRGEVELRVAYEVGFSVRRYDQRRHTRPVSVLVYCGRGYIIVKASEIVPGKDNGRIFPIGTPHHSVNQLRNVPHPPR